MIEWPKCFFDYKKHIVALPVQFEKFVIFA